MRLLLILALLAANPITLSVKQTAKREVTFRVHVPAGTVGMSLQADCEDFTRFSAFEVDDEHLSQRIEWRGMPTGGVECVAQVVAVAASGKATYGSKLQFLLY